MIINKFNQSIIDTGELNLHDALIDSTDFNVELKSLTIRVVRYDNINLILKFENVFDFSFSSCKMYNGMKNNEIFGWEEIPNNITKDNYIEEVKRKVFENDGDWNKNLFAIRILLTNMSEIKIICESIIVS